MKVTKKYCPHCGNLYQRYTNHDKQWTVKSGCPIVSCPNCFSAFVDSDIQEPAFSDTPPKRVTFLKALVAPLFPFGLGGGLFLFASFKTSGGLSTVALIFSLLSLALYAYLVYAIGVKNKDELSENMMKEYKESKKRLSDKRYIIQLIDCGYRVPGAFIENNYPDLLNYNPKKTNECNDIEISINYIGRSFNIEKLKEIFDYNGLHGDYHEYISTCSKFNIEIQRKFDIEPHTCKKWIDEGVSFNIYIHIFKDKIKNCYISKCHNSSYHSYVLEPSKQEIMIFKRIMEYITE